MFEDKENALKRKTAISNADNGDLLLGKSRRFDNGLGESLNPNRLV